MEMGKGHLKEMVVRLGRVDLSRIACVLGIAVLLCLSSGHLEAQDIGPLLTEDLAVSTAAVGVSGEVDVVFDGTKYLVVWPQTVGGVSGTDIYGRFIGTDGAPLGDPFVIGATGLVDEEPVVAFNGQVYLVVWSNLLYIACQAMDINGQLLGKPYLLSQKNDVKLQPDVASDGSSFLVVWKDRRQASLYANDIRGQWVTVDPTAEQPIIPIGYPNLFVSPQAGDQFQPAVAYGGGNYLVTWTYDPTPGALLYDLQGSLVPPLGTPSTPFTITGGTGLQGSYDVAAGIAFDGTNFLVTYTDNTSGTLELKGTRVSTTGEVLDTGFLISGDPGNGWSKIAYGDGEHLVVWNSNGIKGIRVNTAGQVLDPQPANLAVMTDPGFIPVVTYGNGSSLVTWELGETPSAPYLTFAKYAQIIGPIADDSDGDGVSGDLDACPNENATGFDANSDGCIDSISGLDAMINALVLQGVISPELQTSLLTKIVNAEKSAGKDNICAAVNQLGAFKNEVNAQRGTKISADAADMIIAYVNNVIAYLLSQLPTGESC